MNKKGITTMTLKKINKSEVYHHIYEQKRTSKLQIVQNLQMGLSTVSQNLTLLESEGLIERKGYFESTGGRKAFAIQIKPSYRISIGAGILKEMVHIAAVNLYGDVISKDTFPLPFENSPSYYQQFADRVKQFIRENNYEDNAILGVSIATQGLISPDGVSVDYGVIMNNGDMKLSDFTSRLPYPCRLEHDSKAAAYLELWQHQDLDSAVIFLLNRNLGGAIITNRSVHHGLTMHSGSVEHICINPEGPLCYCGNRGCLETYCSANALESMSGVSIKQFFEDLRANNNSSFQSIWNDYLNHLAFAIKNLNMIIDSPVILSGYLVPYITEQDIDYLLEKINGATPFPMTRDHIVMGIHGQYTPAIGAALPYIKEFIASV